MDKNIKTNNEKEIKRLSKNFENLLTNFYNNMIEKDFDYIEKENKIYAVFDDLYKTNIFSNVLPDLQIEMIDKYTNLLISKISEFLARQFLQNFNIL